MISGIYLIFSLAIIFCLSIWLSTLTVKSFEGILIWIMILVAIFVYASIFDLWILILMIIINITVIGLKLNIKGSEI